ncbi:MAG: phosphoribosylformylglycinamidine synthase subunit PurQ [Victivallales bacterium]|nr:phosphoribosylformylglycinamidine synthase subunit PurQ [Victivallales bacterium]
MQKILIILLAITGLPLIVLLLPLIMLFRFGNYYRHGTKIAVAVSNRWPYYLQYLRLPYDLAVWRAGGIPVTVKPADLSRLPQILDKVSGIILTGGEDIDPQLHAGEGTVAGLHNSKRDRLELEILKSNRELDLPLLGICRGAQLLVVSRGGKLGCHDHEEEKFSRHSSSLFRLGKHDIAIIPGTKIHEILKTDSLKVISFHHYAATQTGNLQITARTREDDCIESVECPEASWTIGVQWHPELQAPFNRKQQALFNELVARAAEKQLR